MFVGSAKYETLDQVRPDLGHLRTRRANRSVCDIGVGRTSCEGIMLGFCASWDEDLSERTL